MRLNPQTQLLSKLSNRYTFSIEPKKRKGSLGFFCAYKDHLTLVEFLRQTKVSHMSAIKMVVGLGNPGQNYRGTRHNVGFEVIDSLMASTPTELKRESKWTAEVAKVSNTWIVKPLTFMNESGRAVGAISRFFNISPEEILVITDDVTLNTGSIRLRQRGSHGGQNGMRSIIQHLGSSDFPRLKLGVGKCSGIRLTGHVLGKFPPNEHDLVENMLATATLAVQLCLSDGVEAASNRYNSTIHSPNNNKE